MHKLTEEQEQFKTYLKKIGSGEKTGRAMTRKESAEAMSLMLQSKATPAQIGAFMIAHRIRRPEPQELAGMIDVYDKLGPTLISQPGQQRPICFGMPFDGRTRIAPIYPLTALILLTENQPVVFHGGRRMPTKYGVTSIELFEILGIKLKEKTIHNVQQLFDDKGFGFIYQPDHFSLAESLISYREELGKRPPIASMELLWTPHKGNHLIISGFVHGPTEERAWATLKLKDEKNLITIKGHEGSIDLPTSRKCIAGHIANNKFNRLILNPKDYGLASNDIQFSTISEWKYQALEALNNEGPLKESLLWNAGVYLWLTGISTNLLKGIERAKTSLSLGAPRMFLEKLISY